MENESSGGTAAEYRGSPGIADDSSQFRAVRRGHRARKHGKRKFRKPSRQKEWKTQVQEALPLNTEDPLGLPTILRNFALWSEAIAPERMENASSGDTAVEYRGSPGIADDSS